MILVQNMNSLILIMGELSISARRGARHKQIQNIPLQRGMRNFKFQSECKLCGLGFSNEAVLQTHIQKMHRFRIFECAHCFYLVPFDGFKNHNSQCKVREKPQRPLYRGIVETDYRLTMSREGPCTMLTLNILKNKEKIDHVCHICDQTFDQKMKMEGHIFYTHAFETIACVHCELECSKLSSLQEHVLCQGSEPQKSQFSMTLLQFFYSLRCGDIFPVLVVEVARNDMIKPPVCVLCKKNFKDFKTFSEHISNHHKVTRFQCPICKPFFKFEDFQEHVLSKHRKVVRAMEFKLIFEPIAILPTPPKGVTLVFSLLGVTQERGIFAVKITKSNDKRIISRCSICAQNFTEDDKWIQHICELHVTYKFYTCSVCFAVFHISDLRTHVCQNSNEEDRMFRIGKRQYSVVRHTNNSQLLVKVEEINFIQQDNYCFVCNIKTMGHDSLRRHLKSKHGIKFFKCEHCLEPVRFDEFEKHVLVSHKSLPESVCSMMICYQKAPGSYCTNYSLIIFDGLRLVLNNEKKVAFDCTLCKSKFENITVFQKHLAITHRIQHFKCFTCNVKISFAWIQNHMAIQHDYNESTLFLCVDSEGNKIHSYLEQKITFSYDSRQPRVIVEFVETSSKRQGEFDFFYYPLIKSTVVSPQVTDNYTRNS